MHRTALLLASLLVVVFAALGGACGRSTSVRSNELVIWESYNNEEHAVFLDLLRLYREKHQRPGDPKVVVQRVPFDGLLSKLITAAIAKQTPDICRVDIGHVGRLAYGGVAASLDELGVRNYLPELLPIAGDSNTVAVLNQATGALESHVFGISDQLTCVALYYNKDLFAAAGIEAPPRTLTELLQVSKRLSNRTQGRYGLGLNNSLWWHLPFLYVFGGDVVSADNMSCRLGEPQAIEALGYLRRLYAEGAEAGAWKAGAINPDQGFINQKYAMVVSGPWNIQTYSSVNYGVTRIPGTDETKSATNIGGTTMIVLQNSTKKKAAYEFLRFLTGYEAQSSWVEKTGQLSVNKRVNEEWANKRTPAMQAFTQQLQDAQPRPRLPNYDQLENTVNPLFYSILDGKVPPEQGLHQACQLVNERILAELKE